MKIRNKKLIACVCALSLITGITPYCKDITENVSITASAETYELVDENLDAVDDYVEITDYNDEVTNTDSDNDLAYGPGIKAGDVVVEYEATSVTVPISLVDIDTCYGCQLTVSYPAEFTCTDFLPGNMVSQEPYTEGNMTTVAAIFVAPAGLSTDFTSITFDISDKEPGIYDILIGVDQLDNNGSFVENPVLYHVSVTITRNTKYKEYDGYAILTDCSSSASEFEIPDVVNGLPVTGFEEDAFRGCKELTRIKLGNNITDIPKEAFRDLTNLAEIELGSGIEHIGINAFYNTAWYNSQSDGILNLDNWCVGYKNSLGETDVVFKDGTVGISDYAFYYCDIKTAEFPDSLEYIGEHAFSSSSGLTSVTFNGNITSIGEMAFHACSHLETISLPEGLTELKNGTFRGCTGLLSADIPSTVTVIENDAFYGCNKMKSMTIPESVTSIGSQAIGYSSDGETISAFVIYGTDDTEAESYAEENGIIFVSDADTDTDTDTADDVLLGDANNDGKVNVRDCAFIASALAKGTADSLPVNADFNNDGKINVRDAAAIAKNLATGNTSTDVTIDVQQIIYLDEDGGILSSDYVTCEVGDGWWYTKTAGYYGVVIKQGDKYYPLDDKDPTEMAEKGYATFEEALKLTECSADTKIAIVGYGVNTPTDLYIAYSADGAIVNTLCVDEAVESIVVEKPTVYPDFTGDVVASDDVSVTYAFDLSHPEGTGFSRFDIHMYNEDGSMSFYDEMTITDDNGSTAKAEYVFKQNGKFHLILFNKYETATSVADLTIDSIIGIGEVENDPEDVDPPEVTVEYDETVTGLALGNIFPIKITTNEPCYIRLDGMTSTLSTEFETFVRSNGTYIVKASDEWGNTTDVEITITAFEESSGDELSNDNPLAGADRDSFWDTVS